MLRPTISTLFPLLRALRATVEDERVVIAGLRDLNAVYGRLADN
ncbi:hypothetical protein [Aldersonia kunmingensis]|nr:hypothetical protein [Aldersonia kunmingensis]